MPSNIGLLRALPPPRVTFHPQRVPLTPFSEIFEKGQAAFAQLVKVRGVTLRASDFSDSALVWWRCFGAQK